MREVWGGAHPGLVELGDGWGSALSLLSYCRPGQGESKGWPGVREA